MTPLPGVVEADAADRPGAVPARVRRRRHGGVVGAQAAQPAGRMRVAAAKLDAALDAGVYGATRPRGARLAATVDIGGSAIEEHPCSCRTKQGAKTAAMIPTHSNQVSHRGDQTVSIGGPWPEARGPRPADTRG